MLLLHAAVVVVLGDEHLAGLDLRHLGVADPLDVAVAHDRLDHALGIADAAEAKMADVGLGGDEGHRHLAADLAAAQVGVHDHGELVGRAVAGGALQRADDDGAGVGDELVPGLGGLFRVVHRTDRLGVMFGAGALDFFEGQLGAGGDDQVVVGHRGAVGQLDAVFLRMHALGGLRDEADALSLEIGRHVENDVFALAPVHRDPGIRWGELEIGVLVDDGDLVARAGLLLHVIGGVEAADACAENYDVCHVIGILLSLFSE